MSDSEEQPFRVTVDPDVVAKMVADAGVLRVMTKLTRPEVALRVTDGGFFEMVSVVPTGDDWGEL